MSEPVHFDVVTIFPELFEPFVKTSIVGRAVSKGLASIGVHDLRKHTTDKHRTVDDYPYGGGAGMVMRVQPFKRCLDELKASGEKPLVILFSPRGETYNQQMARELSQARRVVLLCGHYKGVDERVAALSDREISVGDYVLSGGEIPAMSVIDSCVRLIPGVVGDYASVEGDSHYRDLLSPPEYTRPEEFEGMKVPPTLLSGDHQRIDRWRFEQCVEMTKKRRPDLYARYLASQADVGSKDGSAVGSTGSSGGAGSSGPGPQGSERYLWRAASRPHGRLRSARSGRNWAVPA